MSTMEKELRVGMVGYAFMGAAHSQAWRTVNRVYDLPARARMSVICGRDESKVAEAATRLGWEAYTTDWRELITRDDVDVIDVCTPGDSHAEIAIAALEAGKHVLCEKPLAMNVAEGERMISGGDKAGVLLMEAFMYRLHPLWAKTRELVDTGAIGELRAVQTFFSYRNLDPDNIRNIAAYGGGALMDIGCYPINLARWMFGREPSNVV